MSKQLSYSRVEQNVLPGFRQNINLAESTEEVRKIFGFAVRDLLIGAFRQEIDPSPDAVVLAPNSDSGFTLSEDLQNRLAREIVAGTADYTWAVKANEA